MGIKSKNTLILASILCIVALGYYTIKAQEQADNDRIELYCKGKLLGLEEGFDQGFISGKDYQKGVYAAANNQTSAGKNWYFWAGYYGNTTNENSSRIDGLAAWLLGRDNLTTDVNPYRQERP